MSEEKAEEICLMQAGYPAEFDSGKLDHMGPGHILRCAKAALKRLSK